MTTKVLFLLGTAFCISKGYSQEIIKNSKGQSIRLNDNKTWEIVQSATTDNSKILETDLTKKDGDVTFGFPEPLYKSLKNGENKDVDVKVELFSKNYKFNNISVDKVNSMIDLGLFKTKLYLKNKYSFMPREVNIFYSETYSAWTLQVKYTAKNSYGGEVEGSDTYIFEDSAEKLFTLSEYLKK